MYGPWSQVPRSSFKKHFVEIVPFMLSRGNLVTFMMPICEKGDEGETPPICVLSSPPIKTRDFHSTNSMEKMGEKGPCGSWENPCLEKRWGKPTRQRKRGNKRREEIKTRGREKVEEAEAGLMG